MAMIFAEIEEQGVDAIESLFGSLERYLVLEWRLPVPEAARVARDYLGGWECH